MVIPNTCPNLSNIVHTDFELGRVIETVGAADPGITVYHPQRYAHTHSTTQFTETMRDRGEELGITKSNESGGRKRRQKMGGEVIC